MPALAELGPLAILIVALGLAIIAILLVRAVMGVLKSVVGRVPYLGDALVNAVDAVNQAILNKLGSAVSGIESAIGWTWHESAKLTDWLGREIYRHSTLIQAVVSVVHGIASAEKALSRLVHHAGATATGLTHRVGRLEKEWHGIDKEVKKLERDVGKGIGHDLRLHIRALEKEVDHLKNGVIPTVQGIANTAEGEAETALGKIEAIPFPAGVKTWAEAVAVALPVLGLDWLRCRNNPFTGKKSGCGLWSDIASVVGLFADVAIFTNVCAVLDFVTPFVSAVAAPIVVALTDVGAGLCAGSIGPPPVLPVPNLSLPTSPGYTLNLP